MPKIIENLKEHLLAETGRQLEAGGYEAVTIRSIASACSVGVGTVYNYFASKEALVAAYLLEDWTLCMERIRAKADASPTSEPVMRCMYEELVGYAARHASVFHDKAAEKGYANALGKYHALLRTELAAPMEKFTPSPFAAEFIAENLLTWSMAGIAFGELWELLKKHTIEWDHKT